MDNNYTFHVKLFNDKVRVLNQTNSKILTLNAQEARNLHAEIYDLMATIANFSKDSTSAGDNIVINMDGGGFK